MTLSIKFLFETKISSNNSNKISIKRKISNRWKKSYQIHLLMTKKNSCNKVIIKKIKKKKVTTNSK